jgi:foldase protein PrsA
MTRAPAKLACAAAVAGAAAAAVAGCGQDVPSNSVAKVGDSTISKSEFQRWLKTAVSSQSGGGQAAVPDPPEFANCTAARAKQPVPKGSRRPTADALKKQCKREYDELKGQVMQFLIQAQWIQQEAEAQDVKVSNAEVQRSFQDRKKQEFPNDKAFQRFLKTSGMSEQDILYRVKLDVLQQKLTQKVTEKAGKVTDDDVKEYYDKNKKRFAQPERRDLNVVLTKNEARADRAKKQLEDGGSWKQVSKRYSIDEASKSQGGKLPDVTKGQQEKSFDEAIFKAKKGELDGPVKTQFGWYVFEVTKITPASQQSLEQAKDTIRGLLRSQRQQETLDDFIKEFREEYKDKTTCADDYKTAECDNAPKEKSGTGPASGGSPGGTPQGGVPVPGGPQGAPQGAPPQGAPPQGAPPQGAPPGVPPQGAPPGVPPQGAPPQGAPPGAPQGAPPGAPPQGPPPSP